MKAKIIFLLHILLTLSNVACKQGFETVEGANLEGARFFLSAQIGGSIQGQQLQLSTNVELSAGAPEIYGYKDEQGTAARFGIPGGITTDGKFVYIADQALHNIRKMEISTGIVTTVAGKAGKAGYVDGFSEEARFSHPWEITVSGEYLYVADRGNHVIRSVHIDSGKVKTIAGTPGLKGNQDGIGTEAGFNGPTGITTDGMNLYVTDRGNHSIRKINLGTKLVQTIAGRSGFFGFRDGEGEESLFNFPTGITTDGRALYVTDQGNETLRAINLNGFEVVSFEGELTLPKPMGITTDGHALYVTDGETHTITKVEISSGEVSTVAGSEYISGYEDATGTDAIFGTPRAITTDGKQLFTVENSNHSIRVIR